MRHIGLLLQLTFVVFAVGCSAEDTRTADQASEASTDEQAGSSSLDSIDAAPRVTSGIAQSTFSCGSVSRCTNPTVPRFGEALCGTVIDDAGRSWVVPAEVNATGPTCVDMYNDCTGTGNNAAYESQLSTLVIDENGSEVTGHLFGDNFFELYVNGQYVCRDSVGFVPFNSSAARFRAEYPVTFAVRGIDWGTHLGVGMEYDSYNIGDGGFIAHFSDGTVTGSSWKCQVFYAAPVDDASCVGENRDTSACPVPPSCADEPESCGALHWSVPDDWAMPDFDDSSWPSASIYAAEDVTGVPAYVDYAALFGDAEFIWTKNLDLDNQVLCRVTVEAPAP